jgi:hypothetical protein
MYAYLLLLLLSTLEIATNVILACYAVSEEMGHWSTDLTHIYLESGHNHALSAGLESYLLSSHDTHHKYDTKDDMY